MTREAVMFGEAMKRWRLKRGLTQEGLAHEAGITTSYASQVENGKKAPGLSVILKLSRALNLTPGELLSDFTAASMKKLRFDD